MDGQIYHCNRPERDSHLYGYFTIDKGAKTIQWEKETFSNKWSSNKWKVKWVLKKNKTKP